MVCDYRKLNNVTISDNYPLPEIADLVNELAESTIFSTTDLRSGFHQILCTENAKEKLAGVTEDGQFTWKVMPMGRKNCSSVFQRLMDDCFRAMTPKQLVIYLDDLCIHSKNQDDHLEKLESTFKVLRESKLQIQAAKTNLNMEKIIFCGYEISNGKKRPNPAKVEDVRQLKNPTCKKTAQKLFGLLNYHRCFVENFVTIQRLSQNVTEGKMPLTGHKRPKKVWTS